MKGTIIKTRHLLAAMLGLLGVAASAQTTSFTYSGAITSYVVPAGVTNITITTRGAQGGNETMGSTSGGQGAIMTGNFVVTPGQTLNVLTGGQGATAMYVGGGGGGSFVWDQVTSTLMCAAGGGGGAGWDDVTSSGSTGTNASITTSGVNGFTMTSGAGSGGSGGVIPTGYAGYAGGGAGWLSNGNNGTIHFCTLNSTGGIRPLVSGAGGTGGGYPGTAANGGFGGGGGGNARCGAVGGGGGGGYSGGGAGGEVTLALTYRAGGGGGSYNSGTAQANSVGNTGNGLVIISVACTPPAPVTGTGTVCVTGTTTLSSTTTGGTWSSGATTIATVSTGGVVTGVTPGTAIITYSATGACYATTIVTVYGAPSGGVITGTATVCAGLTTTLSNPTATPGGTWSSSASGTASVSPAGVVTGVVPGTATITYTVTTACGTTSVTQVVTVTASPAAITGPLAMCAGSIGTLTSTTPGGTWFSSNPTVAPITSGGVVTAAVVGTSTISYTVGGCAAVAVVTVTTAPGPITGPDYVCQGSTITLGNAVPGGTWVSGYTPVATVGLSTGIVTGISVGGADITYAVGTCTVTTTIEVKGNPAPIEPFTPIVLCVGATAIVTDPSSGTWSSTPTTIATITGGGLVTGTGAGVATISFTDGNGCSARKNVTVNPNPPAVGGSLNVCMSATSTLTNSMPGGTWSISGSGVATVGAASGVLTGISAGSTIVTYTITSTGCYTTAPVAVGTSPAAITGPNAVCAGGITITLANTVSGGSWSSSSAATATVASSGVVSSGAPGTVTISYTTPGCAPATHLVTVNSLPAPIGGMLGVCNGVSSTLTDATPGGVWSSSDATIATIASDGVLSGGLPGTATITYSMPGGCFITAMVTVNPTAPILGPDNLCAGGTGYLTNIVGGGTWTSSNPAVSDVGLITGVLTSHLPGPTYVRYTMPTGCFVTKLITVIPQVPPISGPDRICTGSTATLGDVMTGGTWKSSNLFVATIDTAGILVSGSPDTVQITYTVPGVGCQYVKTMTVDPLPVPVITFSGLSTHTLSTSPYYTSYQWYDSTTGLIPGANTMSLNINTNMTRYYYVVVTDINGCTGSNGYAYVTSVVVCNGPASGISIYPNPAADKVVITSPVSVRAVVTDMTGRTEIEQGNAKELNVGSLAAGVYIITLYDESGVPVAKEKLVKQ